MRVYHMRGDAFQARRTEQKAQALPGDVKLHADDIEDLWHVHNLIQIGDRISSFAMRKIKSESTTGSVESQRVKMTLTILVQRADFDPVGGELRLSGSVCGEVEGIRMGARHTLTLECNRWFIIAKDEWDSVAMERLKEATAPSSERADLWALLMKDGLAQLCHIGHGLTIVKARLETHIPKKGNAAQLAGARSAKNHWFQQVLQAVARHVDFAVLKVMILAGPGFTKDAFWEWMGEEVVKKPELKPIMLSRPKWVLAHASSAYKHALKEVLSDPAIGKRVEDTRAGAEVRALRDFMHVMSEQPDRVTYGLRYVQAACEQGAIEKLLLVERLFRAQHVARRAQYVALVEAVRAVGAKVHIFSDRHPSGEQLGQLSGVAALLRFPLAVEDFIDDGDAEDDEDDEPSEDEHADDGGEEFGAVGDADELT